MTLYVLQSIYGLILISQQKPSAVPESGTRPGPTLRDVLSNPSSLSYLMEFMDRRHRSLLVQFWLTVESFKNPLESVESDSSSEEDDSIQDATNSMTVREDISMINDLYFAQPSPHPALSCISKKHVDIIRSFARDELTPLPATERRVRRSVMLAQRQVEREMEHDFEDFERSELWFRVVGDTESGSRKAISEVAPSTQKFARDASHSPPPFPPSGPRQGPLLTAQFLLRSESSPVLSPARTRTSSSNSDLTSSNTTSGAPPTISRAPPSNIEVLMSPAADQESDSPRAPLFDDPVLNADEQRMEAIQAALTDIIALDRNQTETQPNTSEGKLTGDQTTAPRQRHTFANGKRRRVFDDDPEEDPDDIDDDDAFEESGDRGQGSFQLAAPGDLQLSYEIARLGDNISNLQAQEVMLDTLIKKAELTGDTQELRLLKKSKSSMTRELRELEFQKAQYEQQESANRLLSDRTKVVIAGSTVGEEEGKSVVRYLVEVQQLGPDGSFSSGWVVARRYNEFLNMHNRLRERYGLVRNLDFPGKRLVTALSGSFVDTRRLSLEKYMQVSQPYSRWVHSRISFLQGLIAIPVVCESDELTTFLSRESPFMASSPPSTSKVPPAFPGKGLVRTVFTSVAESIDDMFFGPSMLDVMIQRLTRQAAEFAGIVGSGVNDEDLVAQALKSSGKANSEDALMELSGVLKPLEGETSSFSAPICDLVLAIFELNKKNNWLRRQAIVIILQQVLGGTIERSVFHYSDLFITYRCL
jgi:sorting nexin-25